MILCYINDHFKIVDCPYIVALSPGSLIFSTLVMCVIIYRLIILYTRLGRVADCENCVWASMTFEHSAV